MKNESVLRITKEINFEMAHALYGYDGPCKNIHGHSYHLSVTVVGKVITDAGNPKLGMVVDYSDLKKILEELILNKFDHRLVLNTHSPHTPVFQESVPAENIVFADYQPTCENLLIEFSKVISGNLPAGVRLHHLKLRETPTSYAEWFYEDNRS